MNVKNVKLIILFKTKKINRNVFIGIQQFIINELNYNNN